MVESSEKIFKTNTRLQNQWFLYAQNDVNGTLQCASCLGGVLMIRHKVAWRLQASNRNGYKSRSLDVRWY